MTGIHVMESAEGTAWRCQIDGMLNVLVPLAGRAGAAGDQPVIALIASLQSAYAAAVTIEDRQPVMLPRKGVCLTRR